MSSQLSVAVDLTDPTPAYEQLRRQFALLIETGQLIRGDRLPPLRQLARDLGLAVGTVGRAYQELEAAGLVLTRRGGGTTVQVPAVDAVATTRAHLRAAATAYAKQVAALGLSQDDAVNALEKAWR